MGILMPLLMEHQASRTSATRTSRAAWNVLTQMAFTVVSMAISVISVPFLLHTLGQARFGEAKVITDWLGYLNILEIGLGTALTTLLAKSVGKHDTAETRRLLSTAWRIYFRIALAMVSVGVVLVYCLPRLIKQSPVEAVELQFAA